MRTFDVQVEEYCNNCPDFNAISDTACLYAEDRVVMVKHVIRCTNADRCRQLYSYIKSQQNKEE